MRLCECPLKLVVDTKLYPPTDYRQHMKASLQLHSSLFNDVVDWAEKLGPGWQKDHILSVEDILRATANALWYIDSAHERLSAQACALPEELSSFQDYNKF